MLVHRYRIVGLAHAAQAVAILAFAGTASLPVTAAVLTGPPAFGGREVVELGELAFGPAVAAFLLLAAFEHLAVASRWGRPAYERNVAS